MTLTTATSIFFWTLIIAIYLVVGSYIAKNWIVFEGYFDRALWKIVVILMWPACIVYVIIAFILIILWDFLLGVFGWCFGEQYDDDDDD